MFKTARYEKVREIHLLNLFKYLNSLAIQFFFTFLPPGQIVHFYLKPGYAVHNYSFKQFFSSSRSFTNNRSISKPKKFKIDLPISISRFVVILKTIGQYIMFLQEKNILPKSCFCQKGHETINGDMIVKGNHRYLKCQECKVKTSMKFRTI